MQMAEKMNMYLNGQSFKKNTWVLWIIKGNHPVTDKHIAIPLISLTVVMGA